MQLLVPMRTAPIPLLLAALLQYRLLRVFKIILMPGFACSKNPGSEAPHCNILGRCQLLLMGPKDSFEHHSTLWRASDLGRRGAVSGMDRALSVCG